MSLNHAQIELATGGTLAVSYQAGTANPDFAVLWVHGFGSHRGGEKAEAVRAECERRQWAFASFDFRGHGNSSGTMLELRASNLLHDLAAVRAWLAAKGHSRFGLVGSSMGGFASAWFAKQNAACVVGCVLLAPAFGFLQRRWDSLSPAEQAEWQRTGRRTVQNEWLTTEISIELVAERDHFRPAELMRDWKTPSLLFHGFGDTVVPPSDSLSFVEQVDYPHVELRLLKDGDHRLTAYKHAIATATGDFFAGLI
jgi:pimeloyl-ACP methyl ester carboxylesterase